MKVTISLEKILEAFFAFLNEDKRLTERQAKYRPLIMYRNACIINLIVKYGLSLKELVSLNMSRIQFTRNT